ncbi:MAG: hypothetical protein K6C35_05330 [Eubacterium sp.]|nr:hypothetical protein [Eubacterium sp.]
MRIKRTTSIVMAFIMSLSLLPLKGKSVHAEGGASGATSTGQAILDQDKKQPTELDTLPQTVFENDPTLTSDEEEAVPFLLSEWDELFLYRHGGQQSETAWTFLGANNTGIDMTRQSLDKDGYSWVKTISPTTVASDEADVENKTRLGSYSFLQGTSFDPLGTGRKQYAAYVGWEEQTAGGVYSIIIYDPVKNDYKGSILGEGNWVKKANPHYFEMQNVMAITSGDYDGDGKDTIIVFCCGDGDSLELYEVSYDGTYISTREVFNLDANLVYKDYKKDSTEDKAYIMRHKPVVSLATGDFNGDGIDEFAYSAGFYNGTANAENGWNGKYGSSPKDFSTHVCVGTKDGGNWTMSEPVWLYDEELYTENQLGKTYNAYMMHAGVIGAGDTDGDGIDEIVAVGYTSVSSDNHARITYKTDGTVEVEHFCDWDKGNYVTALIEKSGTSYYRTSGSLNEMSNRLSMSTFAAYSLDYYKDKRFVLPKIVVACGKTNGTGKREDVFISGVLYDFESGSGRSGTLHTPKILNQTFTTVMDEKYQSEVFWVSNVAVGNFDHNANDREQFVYTIMYMESGEHKYNWAYLGVEGGCVYDDVYEDGKLISLGECTAYGGSNIRGNGKEYIENGGSLIFRSAASKDTNAVPLCLDVNEDGVLARHNKNYYAYTDPDVKAVLQAAPYFSELNDIGAQDAGETTYTIETSYGESKTKGWEVSFSAGLAAEAEIGIVNIAVEAGGQGTWSKEYETEYELTKSRTFTATSKDVVVISRIPVLIYVYDIWDSKTHSWIENGQSVTVPLSPTYYLLTIKEYNDFVDEYNDLIEGAEDADKHKLKKITSDDLPEDTQGNPFAYWNNWTEAGNGTGVSLIDGVNALGYTGGSITSEWGKSVSESQSYEHSAGFYFGLTLQLGGDFKGGGEAWVGASTNVEASWGHGNSTTKTAANGAGGTVNDVDPDAIDTTVYPADWHKAFAFSWDFGSWSHKLTEGKDAADVPFYGYRIDRDTLRAPAAVVSDLRAVFDTNDKGEMVVVLMWKDGGTDERPTDKFIIYQYQDDGSRTKIAEVDAGDEAYKFTDDDGETYYKYIYDGIDGRTVYEFEVVAKGNGITTSSQETLVGTHTYAYTQSKAIYSIEFNKTDVAGDIYTITYTDGTVGYLTVKNGVGIADVSLTSTQGLTDNYTILFTDGSSVTYSVKNGRNGVGIASVVKTGSENNVDIYTITYTDGTTSEFRVSNGAAGQDGKSAYQIAVENGFEGTVDEWIASLVGNGIENIVKTGTSEDGRVDIYTIYYTDGSTAQFTVNNGKDGADGKDGEKGDSGEDGRGIVSVEKTSSNNNIDIYTITYTDGTVSTFTVYNGIDGADGRDGADGKDGENGRDGADGKNGENGADGRDGADGKNGENGADGRDGANGKDGKDSADGQNGENGADGRNGSNGADGKNGADGRDGNNGVDSKNGANGADGKNGANGADGKNGENGADGIGIKDVKVQDGYLIITLQDGEEINAGLIISETQTINVAGEVKTFYFKTAAADITKVTINGKTLEKELYSIEPSGEGAFITISEGAIPSSGGEIKVETNAGSESVKVSGNGSGTGSGNNIPWSIIYMLIGWNVLLTIGLVALALSRRKSSENSKE